MEEEKLKGTAKSGEVKKMKKDEINEMYPKLAMTSTTITHNHILENMNKIGAKYKMDLLVINKKYFTPTRNKNIPIKELIKKGEYYDEKKEELKSIIDSNNDKKVFLDAGVPSNYPLTDSESILLVELQKDAGFKEIRVYIPKNFSLLLANKLLSKVKNITKDKKIIPSIDMLAPYQYFSSIHTAFSKEHSELLFIDRGFVKNIKKGINNHRNFLHVKNNSGDDIKRHITYLTWRTHSNKQPARPLLLYLFGFDSFAFAPKGIVNDKREEARTVYDIEEAKLQFFRRKTMCMEYGYRISEKCFCPIHKGIIVKSSVLDFVNDAYGAILASAHDMHKITEVFNDLKSGKIKKRTILKRKVYSEQLVRITKV